MLELKVGNKKYSYESEISVGKYQKVVNLIQDMPLLTTTDDMTSGKFVGIMADAKKLIPLVSMLIEEDVGVVEKFPINKAIEVVNNFFYSNGFWLMISEHFLMPTEVKEMLETQVQGLQTPPSPNSKNLKTKKEPVPTESD